MNLARAVRISGDGGQEGRHSAKKRRRRKNGLRATPSLQRVHAPQVTALAGESLGRPGPRAYWLSVGVMVHVCVTLLGELDADLGAREAEYGQTALHLAAVQGYTNLVQELLDNLADPVCPDSEGRWTPLHAAARANKPATLELLVLPVC